MKKLTSHYRNKITPSCSDLPLPPHLPPHTHNNMDVGHTHYRTSKLFLLFLLLLLSTITHVSASAEWRRRMTKTRSVSSVSLLSPSEAPRRQREDAAPPSTQRHNSRASLLGGQVRQILPDSRMLGDEERKAE